MKKILLMLLISSLSWGADFIIEVSPAANSVDDSKVSSLSISKITNLQSSLDAKAETSVVANWLLSKADISLLVDYVLKTDIKSPTVQVFISGSGTYFPPAGVKYLRVKMVGGGAGSFGSGTSGGGAGGAGGNTTFGSSLLTANGGVGSGITGGTATISSPAIGTAFTGGSGNNSSFFANVAGGAGGNSIFGGGGAGGSPSGPGFAGLTKSGGGGGGAGAGSPSLYGGSGGGAGGGIDAIIPNPIASSYAYSVGVGGLAGIAGSSGFAGAAGGSGYIEITEYYQ